MRKNDIIQLNDIEHVLYRPTMYIGSINEEKQKTIIFDDNSYRLEELNFIPGLLKIIDEVLDNSIDEALRTDFKFGNKIKININDNLEIEIEDNGRGLPIEKEKNSDIWIPEIAVTKLKSGSNFKDDKRKTIGQNGVGVSLTNIFSEYFYIETCNGRLIYKQKFNGISKIDSSFIKDNPKIKEISKKSPYTYIRFKPDLSKFKVENKNSIIENTILLLKRRIFNLSFCFPEISFYFNNEKINSRKIENYIKLFNPLEYTVNEDDSFRIALFKNIFEEFTFLSFVNGIETKRGGSHIDYITNKIVDYLREYIKKKNKIDVKPVDIKNKLFLICSLRIDNALFDNQTKERLINTTSELSNIFENILENKFLKNIIKNEDLINAIIEEFKLKEEIKERQQAKKIKKEKKKISKYIEPLIDKNKELFILEGDSALANFINVRNKNQGAIPLRGKIQNVYSNKISDTLKNEEISNLISILGLEFDREVDIDFDKIIFMTDQDLDGDSICGLLLNLFYKYWKYLFSQGKIFRIISPLYIVKKGDEKYRFYSKNEFEEWAKNKNLDEYTIKYNKGLGSLDLEEYRYMIENPKLIQFEISEKTKKYIDIVYGDDSEKRKEWLKLI